MKSPTHNPVYVVRVGNVTDSALKLRKGTETVEVEVEG